MSRLYLCPGCQLRPLTSNFKRKSRNAHSSLSTLIDVGDSSERLPGRGEPPVITSAMRGPLD